MIATETIIPSKKLKIKLAGKCVENHPCPRSREYGKLVGHKLSFTGKGGSKVDDAFNHSLNAFSDVKTLASTYCESKSSVPLTVKRRAAEVSESPVEKKQKLDRSTTQQCSLILKTLMTHPSGWVFNQPVDPVALKIPDYFSIIINPMDLGTVKSKLEKKMYRGSEEVAEDIKLTFSNAMLYNPPDNIVHKMAKELNEIFEKRWEQLNGKCIGGRSTVLRAKLSSGSIEEKLSQIPLSHSISLHQRSMSSEGVTKPSSNMKNDEVDRGGTLKACAHKPPRKNFLKGTETGSKLACSSFSKQSLRQGATQCIRCASIPCQCSSSSNACHTSADGNPDFDGKLRRDCQATNLSPPDVSKSDPDSDGTVSTLEDERKSPCGQFLTSMATSKPEEQSTPVFDVQLSPKKALRAAMLKSRFAETILKAQQKTLLDQGDKVDQVKMQLEKERLERIQREERARIEAQIRAADMASRKKEEAEKLRQRERDREAARIALQKMERTVEFNQSIDFMKELEKLSGGVLFVQHPRSTRSPSAVAKNSLHEDELPTPLERLGLYMKDEFLECEEEETMSNGYGEDGEMFS